MDIKDRLEAVKHLKFALQSFSRFVIMTQSEYSKQDADRALRVATELRTFETFMEKTYSEPNYSTQR